MKQERHGMIMSKNSKFLQVGVMNQILKEYQLTLKHLTNFGKIEHKELL